MRQAILVLLDVTGMLPGSLLPVIVPATPVGFAITFAQSASVAAAALFCTPAGALAAGSLGVPARWGRSAAFGFAAAILIDLAAIRAKGAGALMLAWGMHGLIDGALTGIGYAAIVRLPSPLAFAAGSALGANWLSMVAKLGLATGPAMGTPVVARERIEPVVLPSRGLALVGAFLFPTGRWSRRRASAPLP